MKPTKFLPILIIGLLFSSCSKDFEVEGDTMYITIGDLRYSVPRNSQTAEVNRYLGSSSSVEILSSITVGRKKIPVTRIRGEAYYRCIRLKSITIPNSVTEIGANAFYECSGLTSITIPNSVTSIGKGAFEGCSSLTSINIPNSVTTIGLDAFWYCSSLKNINVERDNMNYSSIDGVLFNFDKTTLLYCPDGKTRSYIIPNSVTSIGERAFYNCSSLTSVTIPNSVKTIGSDAFYGCKGLTSVTIPNSVTSIGEWAFYNCSSLTSVTIPNSVTSIGRNTFSGCSSLISVSIPNSVTTIGAYAFSDCSNMTSISIGDSVTTIGYNAFYHFFWYRSDVYCYATIPPALDGNVFFYIGTLHVPKASYSAYLAVADQWKAQAIENDL